MPPSSSSRRRFAEMDAVGAVEAARQMDAHVFEYRAVAVG
jgi:hypothetical protein